MTPQPESGNNMAGTLQEGIRLYRLKRWEQALKELLSVPADKLSQGDSTELAYYLGLCYTKLNKYDDALLYLEQVVTSAAIRSAYTSAE